MSRPARARVSGRFNHAARIQTATVTLERHADAFFTVRPLRSRRTFALPLSTVAEMVVQRVIKTEIFLARIEKAKKRRRR